MNCWDKFNCEMKDVCPAYPDHGAHCARVAGTLCQGKEQVMMSRKIEGCNTCEFYNSDDYDHTFKGFVRIDNSQKKEAEEVKAAKDAIIEIDSKIDVLLDLHQDGLISKDKLSARIDKLNQEKEQMLKDA